jgi:hypothetical protein
MAVLARGGGEGGRDCNEKPKNHGLRYFFVFHATQYLENL